MPIPLLLIFILGVACVAFLEEVQQIVSEWLRARGLEKSWLMDAVCLLEKAGSWVKRTIQARDRHGRIHTVQEDRLSPDQITDPDVLKALQQQGSCKLDVAIH